MRNFILRIVMMAALVAGIAVRGLAAESVTVRVSPKTSACARNGAAILVDTLKTAHIQASLADKPAAKTAPEVVVVDASKDSAGAAEAKAAGAVPPSGEQSYVIKINGNKIYAVGSDAVGAMYAAYDLAEQFELSGAKKFAGAIRDRKASPFLKIRAVNPFIHVQAILDPDSWFFNEEYWKSYIDALSRSRFNLLDIHAMYDLQSTLFPNAYLYFLKSDLFPEVGVDAATADRNLAMLNRIIDIADSRGVRVSLMSYHAGWALNGRDEDEPRPTEQQLADYTREMATKIIEKCPKLWMMGFRIGESGRSEAFFRNSYISGIKNAKRPINLFTRSWLAHPSQVLEIADAYPGRTFVEIKYNGEQLGLPYHAISTLRKTAAPSYSYENYTNWPRNYKIIWQIRANGTHRLFTWGDPDFVRRAARSVRFGNADGFTIEPFSAYYPPDDFFHSSMVNHDYFTWDHQRNWLWHMLWGRLGYDPSTPDAVWRDAAKKRYGVTGGDVLDGIIAMSRIVPLVYSYRCLGLDHRNMAPEYETGGTIEEFMSNLPLDPNVMSPVDEWVRRQLFKDPLLNAKMSPEDAAAELENTAVSARTSLDRALRAVLDDNKEVVCLQAQMDSLEGLSRYYANKIRAARELKIFRERDSLHNLARAVSYMQSARTGWNALAMAGEAHFRPLLDTLRMKTLEFTWTKEGEKLQKDFDILAADQDRFMQTADEAKELKIHHAPAYVAPSGENIHIEATVTGCPAKVRATLFFRVAGKGSFETTPLLTDSPAELPFRDFRLAGKMYSGFIMTIKPGEYEYYIVAACGDDDARYPRKNAGTREAKPFNMEDYVDGSAKRYADDLKKRAAIESLDYVPLTVAAPGAPPAITIEPPAITKNGAEARITARIVSASPVRQAVIHYKAMPSQIPWAQMNMTPASAGTFTASMRLTPEGMMYYVEAADADYRAAQAPDFRRETPYRIIDAWDPVKNPYAGK